MAAVDLVLGELGPYLPPAGNAVHLVLGDALDAASAVGISVTARLPLAVAFGVAVAAPVSGRGAALAWSAAATAPQRPAMLPWRAFAGATLASPARLPWGNFDGYSALHEASLRWSAAGPLGKGAVLPWKPAGQRVVSRQLVWAWAGVVDGRATLPWAAAGIRQQAAELRWHRAGTRLVAARLPWGQAGYLPGDGRPLLSPPGVLGSTPVKRGVHLHLCVFAPVNTHLVLGDEICITQPRRPGGWVIEPRSRYMQSHSLTAVRLPDLTPLWVDSIELAADAESTGWSATLNGRTELLALLEQTGPEPTQLRITLDGMVWDLAVTGRRRNRQFGLWSASVTARSLSAWLGEPHLPDSGWLNAAPATAQQVIEEALFATGVALDWQCTDWTIPAGVWSHTGTPMSVVRRVADSIGALVQSPRAGAVVAVMPRYPSLPWEWPVTLPDVTIALDALEFEGDERVDKPAYEGVYVSSQTQGGLWLVARTGTAPALLMPTVTDPLVVAIEAASQRGGALLGAAGPQSTMTLTLPVLTGPGEPGVIDPGNLVLVPDPDGAWKGLVRSTRVRANFGDEVSQTLTIERHL